MWTELAALTHRDDEYAWAGVEDPKIVVTTSHNPSSRLKQFAKVKGMVYRVWGVWGCGGGWGWMCMCLWVGVGVHAFVGCYLATFYNQIANYRMITDDQEQVTNDRWLLANILDYLR